MLRTQIKYNKLWKQTNQMKYGTYFPRPPQKPEYDLIMAFLLAGLGTSCGYSLWTEKKSSYSVCESNTRVLTSILTGLSLSGTVAYILKYIRR